MASIVEKAICSALVLVFEKCWDRSVENLNNGGLTSQKIAELLEREISGIKKTLDGLTKNDLLTSIDDFELGLKYLRNAMNAGDNPYGELEELIVDIVSGKLHLNGVLMVTAGEEVVKAKRKFKHSKSRAEKACNLTTLPISDLITAFRYRIVATILEALGNPAEALTECWHCLEKLHCLPEVKDSFKTLDEGMLSKKKRREIVATVYQINHVVYYVAQSVGHAVNVWKWPFINTGSDRLDPLRDARITEFLKKEPAMSHCCVQLPSIGHEGDDAQQLKSPWGMASDTNGNFIIADHRSNCVKVFDGQGKFQQAFSPNVGANNDSGTNNEGCEIFDVATDVSNNIYMLSKSMMHSETKYGIFVKSSSQMSNFFYLRNELLPWSWHLPSLTVTEDDKVLVRGKLRSDKHVVDVYDINGKFICCFGKDKLKNPTAISAANGSTTIVLDKDESKYYVRIFDVENGKQLYKFVVEESFSFADIAFHKASSGKQIIVAGKKQEEPLCVQAYSMDGKTFLRSVHVNFDGLDCLRSLAVTPEGHIGVAVGCLRNRDANEFATPAESLIDSDYDYKLLVI